MDTADVEKAANGRCSFSMIVILPDLPVLPVISGKFQAPYSFTLR